jgi:phosphomannomutase
MNRFIFDVDGTLTPSRGRISNEYEDFFTSFCSDNPVYLVTGSDKDKTIEQLGERIVSKAAMVFNCSGNDVWQKGENVYTNEWTLPADVELWLEEQLDKSDFSIRTGNHIETRPGCVNFSVVGRNANAEQRAAYVSVEGDVGERGMITEEFNKTFPDLEAVIGGETGIDIYPKGRDKSQILKRINYTNKDKLFFFGDRVEPGGNDFPLAEALRKQNLGKVIPVRNWTHTFETLAYYQEAKIAK